jgi:hypothetical protein
MHGDNVYDGLLYTKSLYSRLNDGILPGDWVNADIEETVGR